MLVNETRLLKIKDNQYMTMYLNNMDKFKLNMIVLNVKLEYLIDYKFLKSWNTKIKAIKLINNRFWLWIDKLFITSKINFHLHYIIHRFSLIIYFLNVKL